MTLVSGKHEMNNIAWKFAILLLGVTSSLVANAEAPYLAGLTYQPVKSVKFTGNTVQTLNRGDTLHPVFSPNGRYLAFTRVVVRDETEFGEAGYLDLVTGKTTILLDANSSKKYAVYSSFVYHIAWLDNSRVEFSISDGDVDSSIITFNVSHNKEVGLRHSGADDEAVPTKEYDELAVRFASSFPGLESHFPGMLQQGVHLPPNRWVFQKDYANQDNHVWMLDRSADRPQVLLKLPDRNWHFALRQVIARGKDLLLVIAHENSVSLVLLDKKGVRIIDRLPTDNHQSVTARQMGGKHDVYFTVSSGHVRTRDPAFLYRWNEGGLRKLVTRNNIIEADVSANGKHAALVSWEGERRVIEVARIGR